MKSLSQLNGNLNEFIIKIYNILNLYILFFFLKKKILDNDFYLKFIKYEFLKKGKNG